MRNVVRLNSGRRIFGGAAPFAFIPQAAQRFGEHSQTAYTWKFHLLGMAKMGNTKYATASWGELSAKAVVTKLKSKKEVRARQAAMMWIRKELKNPPLHLD